MTRALTEPKGLGELHLTLPEESFQMLLAAADGDGRRLLNLLENASDLAEGGVRVASSAPTCRICWATVAVVSTRVARPSTTRYRRCTNRCAARIRMLRCTGLRACSMAAATRCTSPAEWCAWPAKRSAMPTPRAAAVPERLGRAGAPGQPGRGAGRGAGNRLSRLRAEEQCGLYRVQGGHAATRRKTALRKCRCICAMRRPG